MNRYDITRDPEANIRYQRCQDLDASWWDKLAAAEPAAITSRTQAVYQNGSYLLPFFCWTLEINPQLRQGRLLTPAAREPEFQICLIALAYLLQVTAHELPSPSVSPKEYRGGVTFFQGPHALPSARLEECYGQDREAFLAAGRRLGGKEIPQGDAALELEVLPQLRVGVILWLADAEFPAQVAFTTPAALEKFWALDAIWALLNVVSRELERAGTNRPTCKDTQPLP